MRKILLIEDRSHRQKDFLRLSNINLNDYTDILDNKIDNKYEEFIKDIQNDSFDLSIYDVIIAHQSIFINDFKLILGKLKNYCKDNHKKLVLFSGGNETSYINDEYEELGLSSEDFYSQNLKLFLENFKQNKINIRILSFGNKWKLNIILNVLEKISLFIDTNNDEDIDYDEFVNNTKANLLNNLEIKFYQMKIDETWIDSKSEILKLKEDLIEHIKVIANE